jgi:hypothetical protein
MTRDVGDVIAESVASAFCSRLGLDVSLRSVDDVARRPVADRRRRSRRTGAGEQTVRGWIWNGKLKAAKFGTRIGYRIKWSDYEDFLHRRTLTGAITAHLLKAASTAPDA